MSHPAVREAFPALTIPLEDDISTMYVDTHEPPLVTTAIGLMIDDGDQPTDEGLALKWRSRKTGRPVTESAIRAEYTRIKAAGASARAAATIATIELDKAERLESLGYKFDDNERTLAAIFPAWSSWPADAQLAAHSMAWNFGPHLDHPKKGWPTLTERLRAGDFLYAADNCTPRHPRTKELLTSDRSRGNRRLFTNAASVVTCRRDASRLWYGTELLSAAAVAAAARTTPSRLSVPGWYAQRALAVTGHYTGPIDGLFGPMSRRAYSAWTRSRKRVDAFTAENLAALVNAAGLTGVRTSE